MVEIIVEKHSMAIYTLEASSRGEGVKEVA